MISNDKLIAYLTLISGIILSIVAEFYSISGLAAIFSAAVIPVIIMGIALGVGKIVATVWIKQNWEIAHWSVKTYLCTAIATLMLITSMGTFGFLSKAHSDQNLVSGDVLAKIAVYDEKIKISKENIDDNRKALKQMDEAVDQIMGRSQDEKGADKAVAIRRGQAKERSRLLSEIAAEQKTIAQLSEERAPIAAEVRKVDAEVGPIKYIAAFFYGATDQSVLERAVTWVIILLIIVFDPLALMLLIVSQISFQRLRKDEYPTIADLDREVGEPPVAEELFEDDFDEPVYEEEEPAPAPVPEYQFLDEETVEDFPTEITPVPDLRPLTTVIETFKEEPIYEVKWEFIPDDIPEVFPPETVVELTPEPEPAPVVEPTPEPTPESEPVRNLVPILKREESKVFRTKVFKRPEGYVQNEEQSESNLWAKTTGKE